MSENAIITAKVKSMTNFKSEKLNAITAEISGYITETQSTAHKNHLNISKALARVAAEKLYEMDGFKSVIDYAMTTFGWKRANAYAMVQVGSKLNSGELPEGNFSVSQYREMLPMSKEEAQKAIDDGVITEDMTAKEIREEVEVIKPKNVRKEKPEKVYKWYMDGIPGKMDLVLTESALANGEGVDATQRVTMTIGDTKILGYLIAKEGSIRFFTRGEEVKSEVEGEAVKEKAGE